MDIWMPWVGFSWFFLWLSDPQTERGSPTRVRGRSHLGPGERTSVSPGPWESWVGQATPRDLLLCLSSTSESVRHRGQKGHQASTTCCHLWHLFPVINYWRWLEKRNCLFSGQDTANSWGLGRRIHNVQKHGGGIICSKGWKKENSFMDFTKG